MNGFLTLASILGLAIGSSCTTVLVASAASASDSPPATALNGPATVVGERNGAPLYRKEVLSKTHTVDRIFKSMQGPRAVDRVKLLEGKPELLWVVGYRALAVGADGREILSDEFVCHSNVSIHENSYTARFPTRLTLTGGRVATLGQGQLGVDLPSGFGMPVMSDHPFVVSSQILNLHHADTTHHVRQRVEIDFLRDADLPEPLKPLFVSSIASNKLVSGPDGYLGLDADEIDPEIHGEGCSLGQPVTTEASSMNGKDGKGRTFTAHWIVKPGREVNHTRVGKMLRLPFDTRVHVIASHVHPFAEYLELRDLTTGESVYKADVSQSEARSELERVTLYTSEEGIPLYKGHEYELVSVYNNTSGVDQDAMAGMSLYLHGKDIYDFMLRRR